MQTTTFLPVEADLGLRLLEARAKERALPFEPAGDGLVLHLPWGDVAATREGPGLRLTLSSDDRTKLFLLQDAVDKRLDEAQVALERRWSLSDPGGIPPNLVFAKVESALRLSPSYFRVRVRGVDLSRFASDGLHFRLLFPPDAHLGTWPFIGESGRIEWPGGISSWHRPVYTTRSVDVRDGALEFDIFTHDGGRVTNWCLSLRPGHDVAMMGPGGEWYPQVQWLALLGDETALPAIARILEERPAHGIGRATILISHDDDIQDLRKPEQVDVRWLVRGRGQNLLDALNEIEIPLTERFVWFASERSEADAARKMLLGRGLEKAEFRTASYWSK